MREETAIACSVTDCLRLEHRRTVAPNHPAVQLMLWAIFDARYERDSVSIQPGRTQRRGLVRRATDAPDEGRR